MITVVVAGPCIVLECPDMRKTVLWYVFRSWQVYPAVLGLWINLELLCRAIYVFASAIANERKYPDFWRNWEQFEGTHGNPNTWREMTRIRRSVAAQYSKVHFNTTNVEAAVELPEDEDPMAALEAAAVQKQALPGFVAGVVQGGNAKTDAEEPAAKKARVQEENPEEIDIGDDDDD